MQKKLHSVFGPSAGFKSVPWLPNGDAHTIYASLGNFELVDRIDYERYSDSQLRGWLSGLDISPPSSVKSFQPGEPIIFVTHGLTGGSNESYVRAVLAPLTAPKERGGLGMRAVVQNSRGCNRLPILTPKLYNACTTDDIRHAVLWISKTFPGSPIYGIGFSLGSNAITDYTGEEGDTCPLAACVSVANPFDFVAANKHIETHSLMTKYVYNYALGGALQALLARHQRVFLDSPDSLIPHDDLVKYLQARSVTLRDFDELATKNVFGYKDAYDYYAHASSSRFVERIRIPYLGLNALDDPITGRHTLPETQARMNPWVLLVRTKHGGHLGWFEYAPDGSLRRWYVQPVREWLEALIEVRNTLCLWERRRFKILRL
ncbi:AB-hydrolase YheT [Vararia minispora EC-137]|uniref:AB-hydrolase YheT n=1 Tax=Vararia minispora EC-137 TaxID=1314806 RepID=A0ACB8QZN3_9AGAM|nr:AB-hydrolase YheT [Vararia minispora EC-137]